MSRTWPWRSGDDEPAESEKAPASAGRAGGQGRKRQGEPPGRRALREVAQLRERVDELEVALQEAMRLNKRLAEITDVMAEVLLPADSRDDARIRALLEDYDRGL